MSKPCEFPETCHIPSSLLRSAPISWSCPTFEGPRVEKYRKQETLASKEWQQSDRRGPFIEGSSQLYVLNLCFCSALRGSSRGRRASARKTMATPSRKSTNVNQVQPWKNMLERLIVVLPSHVLNGVISPRRLVKSERGPFWPSLRNEGRFLLLPNQLSNSSEGDLPEHFVAAPWFGFLTQARPMCRLHHISLEPVQPRITSLGAQRTKPSWKSSRQGRGRPAEHPLGLLRSQVS